MVKNIGTPSLVERYGGRVDSPPMSHGVSVFSLGDYHGSKTKLSFGRRTQVRRATHEPSLSRDKLPTKESYFGQVQEIVYLG